MDQTPQGLDLHCIVDNLSAHHTDQVAELLEYNRRAAPFRWTYEGRPLKVA